jgi:dihydropteroate synthase
MSLFLEPEPRSENFLWMGILNVTPDSFSDGGKFSSLESALNQAILMESQGATWIDVGGTTSKPGSTLPTAEQEWHRVAEVLRQLRQTLKPTTRISLDTMRASVAKLACEENLIDMINDVCSGEFCETSNTRIDRLALSSQNKPKSTIQVAAAFEKSFLCMHMKGLPQTMQNNPLYENVCFEVCEYLIKKVSEIRGFGIQDVWIDPGIGFGKTLFHNISLLSPTSIQMFLQIPAKLLVGLSRKSFLKSLFLENGGTPLEWENARDRESKHWEKRCAKLGVRAIRSHTIGFETDF